MLLKPLWNKFVNMDRGICVADNAMSAIWSTRLCFLFLCHTCWWHSLSSSFAVSGSPSGNFNKKWSSLEAVRGFKVKDRFPSKSVQRNSISKSVQRNSTRDFWKVWWRPALLWLVRSRFDGTRFPSKSVPRNSMREFQKVWWIPVLWWLVKTRFDGRMWWPYFAHWKASPYTKTGIGKLVFIVNKLCSISWVNCVTSNPIAS